MESEIKSMKDSLPRSVDNVRDATEKQLKELSTELASLKLLMGNRMGAGPNIARTQPGTLPSSNSAASAPSSENVAPSTGTNPSVSRQPSSYGAPPSPYSGTTIPASSSTSRPTSTAPVPFSNNKAAIPAWQMAAANKAKEVNNAPQANGSSTPNQDGSDAVAALQAS
jgi:peroxin-14